MICCIWCHRRRMTHVEQFIIYWFHICLWILATSILFQNVNTCMYTDVYYRHTIRKTVFNMKTCPSRGSAVFGVRQKAKIWVCHVRIEHLGVTYTQICIFECNVCMYIFSEYDTHVERECHSRLRATDDLQSHTPPPGGRVCIIGVSPPPRVIYVVQLKTTRSMLLLRCCCWNVTWVYLKNKREKKNEGKKNTHTQTQTQLSNWV